MSEIMNRKLFVVASFLWSLTGAMVAIVVFFLKGSLIVVNSLGFTVVMIFLAINVLTNACAFTIAFEWWMKGEGKDVQR